MSGEQFNPPSYSELENELFNDKPKDDEPIEIVDMTTTRHVNKSRHNKSRHNNNVPMVDLSNDDEKMEMNKMINKSRHNKSRHNNNVPMVDITNDDEKMEMNKMISRVKQMEFMHKKVQHNLIHRIS